MRKNTTFFLLGIGIITGTVSGLFGGGGGMILVPLLSVIHEIREESIFPSSICIILPICVVSLFLSGSDLSLSWKEVLPYLSGSLIGGILAGFFGKKIPVQWLHRILGILVLWGGIRYIW